MAAGTALRQMVVGVFVWGESSCDVREAGAIGTYAREAEPGSDAAGSGSCLVVIGTSVATVICTVVVSWALGIDVAEEEELE